MAAFPGYEFFRNLDNFETLIFYHTSHTAKGMEILAQKPQQC